MALSMSRMFSAAKRAGLGQGLMCLNNDEPHDAQVRTTGPLDEDQLLGCDAALVALQQSRIPASQRATARITAPLVPL